MSHFLVTTICILFFLASSGNADPISRGRAQGVSEKVFRLARDLRYSWTNEVLSWQRTAFHFQSPNNWINDPNGPLYYNGWYHLFYQYNPDAPVWGLITWGHAVSKDLIHWRYLPYAMVPDQWYDILGVWTGSATILPDGRIVMLYTGAADDDGQVQCLATPANISDPLLLRWIKSDNNPVLVHPKWIWKKDFRDPSTAWQNPGDDKWKIAIGSKVNKTGIAIVYQTSDFVEYELLDGYLHSVPGTGMWECIDYYPLASSEGIKYVMKASLDDTKQDHYAVGTYDAELNKWTPDEPALDVGIGLKYDYGEYYASKTFYDQNKDRRILLGWVRETDAERVDIIKGWACIHSIPRTVVIDPKTRATVLQWPVEEVESLRGESFEFSDVKLEPGSIVSLHVDSASQLDIEALFEIDEASVEATAVDANSGYECTTSGGSINRGALGPFGIVVLAYKQLSELTPIYFYISKHPDGHTEYHFCADELRSSKALDVNKLVYGSTLPVWKGEKLSIRSLVDHSIVESFAQGGRRVISSRIYPTLVTNGPSEILVFNNATEARVKATVNIWKMKSAGIRDFFAKDQAL